VVDSFRLNLAKQHADHLYVRDITFPPGQGRPVSGPAVARKSVDLGSRIHQPTAQMGADEPARTRYQDLPSRDSHGSRRLILTVHLRPAPSADCARPGDPRHV